MSFSIGVKVLLSAISPPLSYLTESKCVIHLQEPLEAGRGCHTPAGAPGGWKGGVRSLEIVTGVCELETKPQFSARE